MNTANGVLHKLCVGAEFAEGRTFSPSCSCGWRGEPEESERNNVDAISEIVGRYERVWSDIAEHGDDLSPGAAMLALEEIKDELTGRAFRGQSDG